ncbi:MAG: tripartite tricarboxylate transporter TctB family protein [Rubrivivax sp.]|nr:tripartite tricarboxylate transporter TctB family protein [Rubrivivax sp.]
MAAHSSESVRLQAAIGAGVVLIAALLALGALEIRGGVGYAGIGPSFLAWTMTGALAVCGTVLVVHALRGGWRGLELGSGAPRGDWIAIAWVSTGILVDAALMTRAGFIVANALCFALAVRGLRVSEGGGAGGVGRTVADLATGVAIAAPAFWLFTKVLGISLPGLTGTGWL